MPLGRTRKCLRGFKHKIFGQANIHCIERSTVIPVREINNRSEESFGETAWRHGSGEIVGHLFAYCGTSPAV
jgi:hypothetical protein